MKAGTEAPSTETRTLDGWRTGTKLHEVGVAHFYLNGYSLCHGWLTTKFDRASELTDEHCGICRERVLREAP